MVDLPVWPVFSDEEMSAVRTVLESGRVNYWTGDECKKFEQEFASYVGTRHGVALANGSVALDLALRAIGIKAGDEVIVTPRSFYASAACIVRAGAKPVFADVDASSQNITPASIEAKVSAKTRAIMCVHHAGWPCEMREIMQLAATHDLKVIEDCAQAHGASVHDRQVGSWGDVGVFSFCQDKIMTTGGEGGMLVTNSDDIQSQVWSGKEHGKSFEAVHRTDHAPGFRWLHESFGSNYRMTEMQAAIGRCQLRKLDGWVDSRRRNAALLDGMLAQCESARVTTPPAHIGHAYYKYYFFVIQERLHKSCSRDNLIREIAARGIPGRSGSCPEIYREASFQNTALSPSERLPIARELGDTSIEIPVYPTLGREHILAIGEIVVDVMQVATTIQPGSP